jgi:hypothetical protein
MTVQETVYPESIEPELIAPCGMDCGLCIGHLREKRRCEGCNSEDAGKPTQCVECRIKNCPEREANGGGYCFECGAFPCVRLRRLDKRYRAKYGMSMIENLELIREAGVEGLVAAERVRWKCSACGGVICVHRADCIYCGHTKG